MGGPAGVLLVQRLLVAVERGIELVHKTLGHAVPGKQLLVSRAGSGGDPGAGEKGLMTPVHVGPNDSDRQLALLLCRGAGDARWG